MRGVTVQPVVKRLVRAHGLRADETELNGESLRYVLPINADDAPDAQP